MDTSVDDSSKRAAPAGESDERDSKKQKPGDESEHMEVSRVERMMQEDFVWSVNDVSDTCEETSKDVQRAVMEQRASCSTSDWCVKLKTKSYRDSKAGCVWQRGQANRASGR